MKKKIITVLLCCSLLKANIFASGYPVFDVSGWLTAIDQLYEQYDMVMNTITTIENQYQQIQHAVERAKSIDWENISFDGDFDIRNDIRDANKRVNRLLTQARTIKTTLNSPSINAGSYGQYSLADLCGINGADRDFFSTAANMTHYMTDNMKHTIDNIEKGLTQKQRMHIWAKYGINPRNYIFVQQSVASVKDQAAKAMAKATDEARQLQREEQIAKTNAIIQAAYSQTDSDGNMTDVAANEANLHLNQQLIDQMMGVNESIDDMASLVAKQMINEENQRQAEADEMAAEIQREKAFEQRVPDSFIK